MLTLDNATDLSRQRLYVVADFADIDTYTWFTACAAADRAVLSTECSAEIIPLALSASGQAGLSHYRETTPRNNIQITAD